MNALYAVGHKHQFSYLICRTKERLSALLVKIKLEYLGKYRADERNYIVVRRNHVVADLLEHFKFYLRVDPTGKWLEQPPSVQFIGACHYIPVVSYGQQVVHITNNSQLGLQAVGHIGISPGSVNLGCRNRLVYKYRRNSPGIPKSTSPVSNAHHVSKGTHQTLLFCIQGIHLTIYNEYIHQWWDPFPVLWDPYG